LPEEASGQLESQRESLLLSAAIEEAKRSPFHRADRADPVVNAQTVETAARPLAAGTPIPFGTPHCQGKPLRERIVRTMSPVT